MRLRDMNPATMPGFGDPETWGGRTPYGEAPDYDEPIDWNRLTQDEMIDNEEEYPREQ